MKKKYPFDTSQLKTYMKCPFVFYIKYVQGLGLIEKESSYHLEFGKRFHTFLEDYYKKLKTHPVSLRPHNEYLQKLWSDYVHPSEEIDKTQESGIVLCKEYAKQWSEVDKSFDVVAVEEQVELEGISEPFVVKLDTVLCRDDQYYSLEHKSTTIIRQGFFNPFHIDLQVDAQALAVRQRFGSCSGVIVSASGVKKYVRKRQDGSGPGIICDFERRPIGRTNLQLDDALQQINWWIKQINQSVLSKSFPKHKGGFSCYFPKECKHVEICQTSKGIELDQQFVVDSYEKINPFDYLDE